MKKITLLISLLFTVLCFSQNNGVDIAVRGITSEGLNGCYNIEKYGFSREIDHFAYQKCAYFWFRHNHRKLKAIEGIWEVLRVRKAYNKYGKLKTIYTNPLNYLSLHFNDENKLESQILSEDGRFQVDFDESFSINSTDEKYLYKLNALTSSYKGDWYRQNSSFVGKREFVGEFTKFKQTEWGKIEFNVDMSGGRDLPPIGKSNYVLHKIYPKERYVIHNKENISSDIIRLPIDVRGNMNFITINIGGKDYEFLIDTGASDILINSEIESHLINLGVLRNSDYLDSQTYIIADGSSQTLKRAKLHSLQINGIVFNDNRVAIGNSSKALLLGMSFLSQFDWKINGDVLELTEKI